MRKFTITAPQHGKLRLRLDEDLNEQQRAAVTAGEGPKLVIAGAGSGKTRTITYRVAYLVAQGIQPSRILLATFTNKAAREMLHRVEALTGSQVARLWGGTFHSIGNRILRKHISLLGYQPSYSILDEADSRDLLKLCTGEHKVAVEKERFPSPAVLQEIFSLAFNRERRLTHVIEQDYPHFINWMAEIEQLHRKYQAKKRQANAVDYDDLLGLWLQLLRDHPAVLAEYGTLFQYLLVDEYQDTNTVQAELVELLAGKNSRNLMVVGDDAQSIYGWRGANFENILRFPERNPGTEIFKLEYNYRSTPEILNFTNASILHNSRQHHKVLKAVRPSGLQPVVVPVNDAYQEAAFVCERMLQLRDEGIPLAGMAVLYRAHAHSVILQTELLKRNIPYEIRSGVRFFEQAHIKDVVAYLKILSNPADEVAWRRLILMMPKVGPATADKLWQRMRETKDPLAAVCDDPQTGSVLPKPAAKFWQQFLRDLRHLRSVQPKVSASGLVAAILETGYLEYLRTKYEGYQSRLEDIESLALFAKQYDSVEALLSELILLGELYGQDVVAGPSGDQERVVLSTVHQAKGLEWQAVFAIRMCEGSFPSVMGLREDDGEEEERRIFYVATTRAKDELYLTYPIIDLGYHASPTAVLQASRFLQEIDHQYYEEAEVEEAYERSDDG